jgi:hypothetical protein
LAAIPPILASDPRQVTKRKRKCAAHYEQNGPANVVLKPGEVETARAGLGEVRVKLAAAAKSSAMS